MQELYISYSASSWFSTRLFRVLTPKHDQTLGYVTSLAPASHFILFLFYFILHVCHYKSTNTIYNYTTMMSHKDYINISHKYYDGWNDHTEIKSPITGFHKIH